MGFQHLQQNPFPLPRNQFGGAQFAATQSSGDQTQGGFGGVDDFKRLGFPGNHDRANGTVAHNFSQHNHLENKLQFGSFSPTQFPRVLVNGNSSSAKDLNREVGFREPIPNGLNRNQGLDSHGNSNFVSYGNSNPNANVHSFRRGECDYSEQERGRVLGENYNFHPQAKGSELSGFMSKPKGGAHLDFGNIRRREFEHGGNRERPRSSQFGEGSHRLELGAQLHDPVRPSRSDLLSALALNIEERVLDLDSEVVEGRHRDSRQGHAWMRKEFDSTNGNDSQERDNIGEQLADSLLLEDEPDEKSDAKFIRREKDCRGNRLLTHRERVSRKHIKCRGDIDMLTVPLLRIYESLIPPKEEKEKQMQLLTSLEKLVVNEWPHAHLCLFGSCANSFGVSNSDVDVCLVLRDADIDKSEILLKLAEILQSANFQNVQALTRARVPIIKLKDPVTGVSCDICINNVLAVVNTKLLRDYAQIDVRLPQLAFIVKHWAKSRGVNETYQGTLSSYAYVLMCIHFLQHRDPPILPCLQEAKIVTYQQIVDNIECAYFDQVEKLKTFGSDNKESVARLVWGFFHYWAYCHDYANTVVSVRTKNTVSKRSKDWTRRIGKDRHLICIEDPFETSHDLGRVVDKYSIKVLREEFERAATILQTYPNPCEKLFEPFVPS